LNARIAEPAAVADTLPRRNRPWFAPTQIADRRSRKGNVLEDANACLGSIHTRDTPRIQRHRIRDLGSNARPNQQTSDAQRR
jgi:hypothetical protein